MQLKQNERLDVGHHCSGAASTWFESITLIRILRIFWSGDR
jgi:hypothetical protein